MSSFAGKTLKALCLGYFGFLTVLLLTRDPSKVIGMGPGLPRLLAVLMPIAHLLSFSVLTFLTMTARWPLPRWFVAALLIGYGGATEVVQSLVPGRTPEMTDWLQNIGGVLVGGVLFLLAAVLLKAAYRRLFLPASLECGIGGHGIPAPFDAWDTLLRVRREVILPSELGSGD